MKNVSIASIKINNPLIATYVKKIKAWDGEQKFKINNDSFYAIYLDEQFLGASTMDFEPEASHVNILLINGSNQNYEQVQTESTKQLTNIALQNYGAKTVRINDGKKLVLSK